jgi:5-(carboxyamino)imidazole ribonucleotide mutase
MFELKQGALVGIVTGSASDKAIVEKVTSVLDDFGVIWEWNVLSAHRTPNKVAVYAQQAEERGIQVLVGIAGLAAALPGVLAGHSTLPIIGVPGDGGPLNGVDALHSIVQMPPGIPVATVGIGNGKNAAYLAISILALGNASLKAKLKEYRKSLGDIES